MESKNKYHYNWTLKDAIFTKDKGKVFSCFACGGGSTMGYKLAGFDVLGMNEIDPKMSEVYIENHSPKYAYIESITDFVKRNDLPDELYNLDILDGSPPCSSFSIAGNRQKDWGKKKKFREGQAHQVLDTLFFDFIDLAKKLQPKVVIAENVKGILMGEAINYVRKIYNDFDKAGYYCLHFLLNSKDMGVPQKRERVFFICIRKDLCKNLIEPVDLFENKPKLNLDFNFNEIPFSEVYHNETDRPIGNGNMMDLWNHRIYGDIDLSAASDRIYKKPNSYFNWKFLYKNKVANTITGRDVTILFDEPRHRNTIELCLCGSYPLDYNFLSNKPYYLIGMSVPPLMIANIADQIYNQWLSKI